MGCLYEIGPIFRPNFRVLGRRKPMKLLKNIMWGMTKYETVVGLEETGRIQFLGYPKRHSGLVYIYFNLL